jgi:hypothetical protein
MKVFLIVYDRHEGTLITFQGFETSERSAAQKLRLRAELEAARLSLDHEIVLLEADSEADLQVTHRRYFKSFRDLY